MKIFPSSNNFIGIDLGSTSIKIVELRKEKDQLRLVNYGFSENTQPIKIEQIKDIKPIAKIIKKIQRKSHIRGVEAYTALPTFSVFTSVLNLSNVLAKDIPSAVHWEAKKVIPLPLEDMILDWKQIDMPNKKGPSNVRVLLTGAPKPLVRKYISIFKETDIRLKSMETETFSLIRSLVGNDKSTIMIVEIGASTTDVTIIDKGIPMLSRSIDVGGDTITKTLSNRLKVSLEHAEQFKYDLSLESAEAGEDSASKFVMEALGPVVNEIKYAMELYSNKNNINTEKIILSGGSAMLPNLPSYLSRILDKKVVIGNPWDRISCQVDLKPLLDEIGPRMSVAVGLAMYGFGK
jgi:type IV pilus assembly protein PilM